MDERETRAMMEDVAAVMKSLVTNAVTPLVSRLDALEKRLADMPVPKDGKDADVDEIAALAAASLLPDIMEVRAMVEALQAPVELPDIPAMIAEAVKAIPTPKDGEPGASVTLDDVTPLIASEVEKAISAVPPAKDGQDGKSVDIDELKEFFKAHVGQEVAFAVSALPPAEKGKDADPVEVAGQIAAEVERAVAALPAPQDGKSVTVEDLRPVIDESVQKAVAAIPVPKDGTNGADGRDGLDVVKFIRDDKGHLNGILRDGTTVDLGEYVGKDGAAGINGKDGRDGVSYDGIEEAIEDGGRFLVRRHKLNDEVVSEQRFLLATMIYRGVFKEGQVYRRGDTVTWGGSLWHCDADGTDDKPDGATKSWTLASKRGRDGKDGTTKPPPKPGPVKVG